MLTNYYHEHFIRGHPELMEKMVRIKIKGNNANKSPTPPPPLFPPTMACGGEDNQHDNVGAKRGFSTSPSRSKVIRTPNRQSYDPQHHTTRLSPKISDQQTPAVAMGMGHRRRCISDPTPYVMPNTSSYQPNHDNSNRSASIGLGYCPLTANGIPSVHSLNQLYNGYMMAGSTFQGQEEQRVVSNMYPSHLSTSDMQMQPSTNAFSSNASSNHQLDANNQQPSFTQADQVTSGTPTNGLFSNELSTELRGRLDLGEEDEFDRYIDNSIHFID